jgi:hypothetical protein
MSKSDNNYQYRQYEQTYGMKGSGKEHESNERHYFEKILTG